MKISACFTVFAACATMTMTAPAGAGTLSLGVNSTDLDLATPEGVEALRVRIVNAALQVCDESVLQEYRGGIDKTRCLRSIRISPDAVAKRVKDDGGLVQLVRRSDSRGEPATQLARR